MLPPKKNQAVRDEHKDREENEQKDDQEVATPREKEENNKEKAAAKAKAEAAKQDKQDEDDEDEEEEKHVNIFEETVIDGKRKHFINKHDQVLKEWMKVHFEDKEGRKCAISQCYSQYLKLCVREEINNAMAEFEFSKMMRKSFPNGFGLKDDSPLKGEVREIKHNVVKNKVKADTLKLKTKDVIHQAFDGLNNPVDGMMFNSLKRYMIVKFPALQLDVRPKILLRGLEMGVYHGYVELLRGVGRAGRYRWFDPEKHEAELKERKKKKKTEPEAKDGEKKEGEESADSTEEGGAGDKKDDGAAEEGEDKKESAEDSTQSASEDKKPKKKAAAKKKKSAAAGKKGKAKPKKKKSYRKYIVHSAPQRIEDTFPLALTFMAEPKETSFSRILSYIDKFYDVDIKQEKLQKVLEKGSEKGYWQLVRGANKGAIYQLTVDTFDPTDDDDLIGKVVNAIMASVDPKSCSARALKEYVIEFHPDYRIVDRPHLFKKSLERALTKNLLRQVTGIGASGTFELAESFVPSPVVLAGKDTASDYEESESSDVDSDEGMISDQHEIDVSQFLDAYKPRPTKRRGKVREVTKSGAFDKNAAYIEAQIKQQHAKQLASRRKPKKRPASSSLKVPKKKARVESSAEEDSSSDEEQAESISDEEVDSTYGSETGEKYRPRPSSSRGGTPRGKHTPAKKSAAKGKKSTPAKKSKAKSKREREPTPPPAPKKTPRKAPTQRSEAPPKKTPAAKGKSPAGKGKSTPAAKKTASSKRKRN